MKKPIVGNYNWTPRQMARVNSQRESRGQAPLASYNGAQDTSDYDQYYNEIKKRQGGGGIKKRQYDIDKEAKSQIPISERIKASGSGLEEKQSSATDSFRNKREEEQAAFRERFRKKQMLPGSMGGMKSGVSSPSSSSSYARGMA
jgi:hypothetical protein